ncbi:helix-turn-helix domain-containing protein [Micromonospora sp. NPDC047527]|uniref:helix-turn-helix domain-containing protein n=1 Tax=Micromonospora sp. NPDC047527 TaxID=3155144 RepID=UPI0033F9DBB9
MDQPQFGQRLRALRLGRGLSQAALAGDYISTGYLSRLESGARQPTPRVVAYLAERLGVEEAAFLSQARSATLAIVLASVTSGVQPDSAERVAEALRLDDGRAPELRWQALWLLAGLRSDEGAHEAAYALLTELLALAEELDVPELLVRTCTRMSRCLRVLGDIMRAREYAERAVKLSTALALPDRTAALHVLIPTEAEAGRLSEARRHADLLCALTEGAPGTAYVEALWASATVSMRQGDYRASQEMLEQALRLLDSHEDLKLWMRLRLAAASLYLQSTPAQVAAARARLEEVAPVLRMIGSELHQQEMLSLQAHLAFEEGRFAEAQELAGRIDDSGGRLSFRDRLRIEVLRGRLSIVEGDTEAGIAHLQRLAHNATAAHNLELAAEAWRSLAETLSAPARLRGMSARPPASSGTDG